MRRLGTIRRGIASGMKAVPHNSTSFNVAALT